MKKIKLALILAMSLMLLTVFTSAGFAADQKMWRWGTSSPGAYGYKVSAFLADFLRRGMPEYDVTVYPFSSTTANIKNFLVGKLESTYSAEPGLRKLYAFQKPFKGFEPNVKQMPVQSFWAYTMETHILTLPENKDKIKTWADLEGKKVYMTKAGYMNNINIFRAIEDINGVDVTHVEVDMSKVADALRAGTIDATAAYTTGTVSLASWIKVLDVASDLAGVNPTPEQIEKLKAAGFAPVEIQITKAYTSKLGVDKLYGVPFFFGFHQSVNFPAEDVYKALKVFEAAGPALVKLDPGFGPLAKDFAGFQVKGIESLPEVPVHPGLAKFLKEKGMWNDSWVIADEGTIAMAIEKMKAKAK